MSFADIQSDHTAALIPRTAEALMADTPAPAARIIRDAGAHAYAMPTPANQTAAPDPLDGLPVRFSIPVGFGYRVGIARNRRAESIRARLRRLEAAATDDSQGALERQDAQGEVDTQNLTRVGLLLAVLSTALMLWLVN